MENKLCRIAIFYDGNYFFNVSNYYQYYHPRRARLKFEGLHEFIKAEVSKEEGIDVRHCQIVDASYFRGRLTAQQAQDEDKLFNDRLFEDVLMRANITLFQRHLKTKRDGGYEERGIDVWLALEAFEMAGLKKYDVCVLVGGDSDFAPLFNKLNTLGSRVMLISWDFSYTDSQGRPRMTRTSAELIDRANYRIMMETEIDSRERRKDSLIDNLFMEKSTDPVPPYKGKSTINPPLGKKTGTIVNLIEGKGYGFIRPSEGGENLFFHYSDVTKDVSGSLSQGLAVAYTPIPGRSPGESAACEIELLEPDV